MRIFNHRSLATAPRHFGVAMSLPILTMALTACGQVQDAPPVQEVSGKIDWVYDYEQGQRLSRRTGKPMFVVFRCER